MGSMASFSTVVSGLQTAQRGLAVTGHNVTNTDTDGYTRQRMIQSDDNYVKIGLNASGYLKVGLGTNIVEINQIRSEFLDRRYRAQVSKTCFYDVNASALNKIEQILGELYGDGRMSDSLTKLWNSLQELVVHPDGVETRSMFISNAYKFIDKANQVSDELYEYQKQLNEQIIGNVSRINQIAERINQLNEIISTEEAGGNHANDYRDERNLLVDELSQMVEVDANEDKYGRLIVLIEGKDLVANGAVNKLGLRYSSSGYPFVEPVFTNSTDILKVGDTARRLFTDLNGTIGGDRDNDYGSLKALMLNRGTTVANYATSDSVVGNYTIMSVQKQFDTLIHEMVTLFNNVFSPIGSDGKLDLDAAPYDLNGEQSGVELFSRLGFDRFDENGVYIEEDETDPTTLYSIGNIQINPAILNEYNLLATMKSDIDKADSSIIQGLLDSWQSESVSFSDGTNKYNFEDYYKEMIVKIAEKGQESLVYVKAQEDVVTKLANDRTALSGVSLDEELTNMMKYQYAYNAAARVINYIDSMLDTIINKLKA